MKRIDIESSSVQSYLQILQGVISRMASNSAACKTWCIALVTAIIVVLAEKETGKYVWISAVPIILLCLLDAYYLGLERSFCSLYNGFIGKLHGGVATVEDIFVVAPTSGLRETLTVTLKALTSISVWPFYILLCTMLVVLRIWVL